MERLFNKKIKLNDEEIKQLQSYADYARRETQWRISGSILNLERDLLRDLRKNDSLIVGNRKENGQWGYYCSQNIEPVVEIIDNFGIKSLVDLGAGTGSFLMMLEEYFNFVERAKGCKSFCNKKFLGVEIEPELVEISKKLYPQIKEKVSMAPVPIYKVTIKLADFMEIRKNFLYTYDAIYMYEPVWANLDKFVANLIRVTKPGQYIILKPAGGLGHLINHMPEFEAIKKYPIFGFPENLLVWKRIEKLQKDK